ncbi:hypothetical protein O9929_20965 [Vibrio lentus]|nr:hypothetical protein [Vibrio lentus]
MLSTRLACSMRCSRSMSTTPFSRYTIPTMKVVDAPRFEYRGVSWWMSGQISTPKDTIPNH